MATFTTEKPVVLRGTIKQISDNGPVYEVLEDTKNDRAFVRIRLVETGEELDYPLSQVLSDREAV